MPLMIIKSVITALKAERFFCRFIKVVQTKLLKTLIILLYNKFQIINALQSGLDFIS